MVFHIEILPISVLQEIWDKIKETPIKKDEIHLSPPMVYYMPELPEDWLRAASDTFENNFKHFQRYTNACIKNSKSLKNLKYPSWLNDEVIEGYCQLISTACPNAYMTSSFALESPNLKLKRFINEDNYRKLLETIAIIPINERKSHWTFACVWLETETVLVIEYYDSFSISAPSWQSLPLALTRWIDRTFPSTIERKISEEISAQQPNASDCGLFALMGMRMRAMGWPVFHQERADDIMPKARHRVFAEIIAGHLDPSLEDMKTYNSIVSGETTFPDSPITQPVSYSVEMGRAGCEVINLVSPETESFEIDGEKSITEDVQKSNFDMMKTDVEGGSTKDIHQPPPVDSIEMDGENHLTEDVHQLLVDSIEKDNETYSIENVYQHLINLIEKDIETRSTKNVHQHPIDSIEKDNETHSTEDVHQPPVDSIEKDNETHSTEDVHQPPGDSMEMDGENHLTEDVHQPPVDSMEMDNENHLTEDVHQPPIDSIEKDNETHSTEDVHQPPVDLNGKRDSTEEAYQSIINSFEKDEGNRGDTYQFELASMVMEDEGDIRGDLYTPEPKIVAAVESEKHVIESHSFNVPNLGEATGQENPDFLMESQDHEGKLELKFENESSENPQVASERSFQTSTSPEDKKGKKLATQKVISRNLAQKHSSSFVPILPDVTNVPLGNRLYQDNGRQGDVATRRKRQRKEDPEDFSQALLAADNFASQEALVENLRAAIIAYRSRDQSQREHDSLATLWSNIRPEELTPQTIFQRYTRFNFARRWFEAKGKLPRRRGAYIVEMKKMLKLKGTFEEQDREFKAASTYARRCSFWVDLINQLPFSGDSYREVAVCACGESTSELERLTDTSRKKYFERILFRIKHKPNDIMEKIREAGPLYKALIESRLPDYQLTLELNVRRDGMTFAEMVSLEPVPDRMPIFHA
ncbi:hypothetical protein OCU04_004403 [Sclerotinia nivalis]|uniref:Ubiquitin-like protease family profile domain-containing protein n=1 Tax=Sclerotinia nivalis TaxID=352851 RepID=A0A9X0DNH1_9HELO|nr:hypothetical protein OCU04_004403 [Sclerotinia nivalis]